MEIELLVKKQRAYFEKGKTRDISWRLAALKTLKKTILKYEKEIDEALYADLRKSSTETYMCETGMVLSELSHMIRHLRGYAREKQVITPLAQFHAKSFTSPEPYGVVLVMSPWNYPFMLAMEPLIGAIAAGNCVIVKPSAYAPATADVIEKILGDCFAPHFAAVVKGGRAENTALLEQRFDFIFFTGSVKVGKLVMEKASRSLTPVCLELGGKSPCIVDKTANIRLAARRIVFGKYLNLGQTCVAPDYLFVHEDVKERLLKEIEKCIRKQFGARPLENPDYGRIVNEKHFDRLLGLMEHTTVSVGGECRRETLQIEPTVLTGITPSSAVMQEEIFGPLLPVMTFREISEVISYVTRREKPLALYLFTGSRQVQRQILKYCSFGGGCINDTIIHLATSRMGFGGVGGSGMGSYHGKDSFELFSHRRSIVKKYTWIDLPIRYQPYRGWKKILLKMFLK
ncbi:MAG: aldehyde dehydrogenase [Lachnospiraceae bacterium]|nr:aldehyde dehydrogenase [Lachnospiraceae bacterium]